MLLGKSNTTLPDGIEDLVRRKVNDEYGRCSNTRRDEYDQYENKRASNGHTSPDYNAYHQMQQELLTKHGDLTWPAMKEVLDAHEIEYFPELQDQLNQIAENILHESFARPWYHPAGYEMNSLLSSEEIDGRNRNELENARASSLHTVSNDIELYCKKLHNKPKKRLYKELVKHPLLVTIIGGIFVIAAAVLPLLSQVKGLEAGLEKERAARISEAAKVAELAAQNTSLEERARAAEMRAADLKNRLDDLQERKAPAMKPP